jgi:hypothetical protein
VARRSLEREGIYLDRGRRTTQLMRDSLGSGLTVRDGVTRKAWFYLAVALVLGPLGWRAATLVDEGFTHGWADWARVAWALGLVFACMIAVGALVAFAFALKGDQETGDLVFRAALVFLSTLCLFFAAAHLLQHTTGFSEDRTFLIGIGLFVGICTWLKPWWFWDHPKATFLRDIIGDTATTFVYYLVSLACIGYALFGRAPHV